MSDIFISYCKADYNQVKRIVNKLHKKGFSIWWDEKIEPGKSFDEIIAKHLDSAKCVLVFWSNNSVNSDWVKEEAEAGKKKKNLIPVLIDEVQLPLGFGRIQTTNLINISDHNSKRELKKLYNAISNIINKTNDNNKNNELIEKSIYPKNKKKLIFVSSSLILALVILFLSFLAFFVHYIYVKPNVSKETNSHSKQFTNSINMKFVLVEHGDFIMGNTSENSENFKQYYHTQHKVEITKSFYIQTTEVTQKQWKSIMNQNPSKFYNCDSCPVENVSWYDANSFINKLNIKEKTNSYRLPYESEWEYACQKGKTTITTDNNNLLSKTEIVDRNLPNAIGLYGMVDNVYEWCFDWYGEYPNYSLQDPNGPNKGEKKINRGGSWHDYSNSNYCNCTTRGFDKPDYKTPYIGFRVAISVK